MLFFLDQAIDVPLPLCHVHNPHQCACCGLDPGENEEDLFQLHLVYLKQLQVIDSREGLQLQLLHGPEPSIEYVDVLEKDQRQNVHGQDRKERETLEDLDVLEKVFVDHRVSFLQILFVLEVYHYLV